MLDISELAALLRDPVTRSPLRLEEDAVVAEQGEARYLRDGLLVDFVADASSGSSEEHYEKHPFDVVDGSTPETRRASVEEQLLELVATFPEDALILDVGSGPGRTTIPLHEEGRTVLPIDLTRAALDCVAELADVPRLRASNLNLPLRDGIADLVISTGVVHHTPDPRQAIAENCRVLKPGGRLYLRLFNRDGYYRFAYGWLGGTMRLLRRCGPPGRLLVDGLAFQLYRLLRRMRTSKPVPVEKLRSLFENYFLKDTVQLLSRAEVDGILATSNMDVDSYRVRSTMHCYVATKRSAS